MIPTSMARLSKTFTRIKTLGLVAAIIAARVLSLQTRPAFATLKVSPMDIGVEGSIRVRITI